VVPDRPVGALTAVAPDERHCASGYGNRLLEEAGAAVRLAPLPETHPVLRWAQCGAMALTGEPGQAPEVCPVPLAAYADGLLEALRALRPGAEFGHLRGAQLLTERAALAKLRRGGAVAAGGSCRLLRAADGWLALNLARAGDWELLPAWLEESRIEGWAEVATLLGRCAVQAALERGRLLGLPLAPLDGGAAPRWCRGLERRPPTAPRGALAPVVVDLSALWAGPLCTHLLQRMGARVIKVESLQRPDAMRDARDGFFDLLNAGKESVALDFSADRGRAQLRALLRGADIVVESARPRALRQLDINAEEYVAARPSLTWVSISGYGREEPGANWVAFGDDAAVAGGLSRVLEASCGRAMFCADAIADPLTGMHAALAAWTRFSHGGGGLLSLALSEVIAHCVACAALDHPEAPRERAAAWAQRLRGVQVAAPCARAVTVRARPLGVDTQAVLATLS
jgi:crotonobetainyl-CoA:carnitine CoA-transferase CaiB-like acyl-CoA transferase